MRIHAENRAAELLMLASVMALILYVHQAGQKMRVSGLIDLVGDQTREMIKATYPEPDSPLADVADVAEEDVVASPEAGVVYRIEYDALVEEARRADLALELVPAMGDFVTSGAPLMRIQGEGGARLDRGKVKQLVGWVANGATRTIRHTAFASSSISPNAVWPSHLRTRRPRSWC